MSQFFKYSIFNRKYSIIHNKEIILIKNFCHKSTKFMTKKLKGMANENYRFKETDEP